MTNAELLHILACPVCRGGLEDTDAGKGLVCRACAVVYPVMDGIPVMLVDESIPCAEWEKRMKELPTGNSQGE